MDGQTYGATDNGEMSPMYQPAYPWYTQTNSVLYELYLN